MSDFFARVQEWFAHNWQFVGLEEWLAQLIAAVIELFKVGTAESE